MRLTASQLQTQHKALVDALKRGETVEITYHGQIIGIVHPERLTVTEEALDAADAFFGMHKDMTKETVEDEVRAMRVGRRKRLNAL